MNIFFYWLLKLIRFKQFKCRSLTEGEIQLCQGVFANQIHYANVRIMNHPFLPWQAKNVLMAPTGYIHVRNLLYKTDYSLESESYRALFIHEMTHIYQHQLGIAVLLKGALLQSAYFLSFKRYDPYRYTFKAGKSFWDYNIEQQGDIARDIYLKKIPNIILKQTISHS